VHLLILYRNNYVTIELSSTKTIVTALCIIYNSIYVIYVILYETFTVIRPCRYNIIDACLIIVVTRKLRIYVFMCTFKRVYYTNLQWPACLLTHPTHLYSWQNYVITLYTRIYTYLRIRSRIYDNNDYVSIKK